MKTQTFKLVLSGLMLVLALNALGQSAKFSFEKKGHNDLSLAVSADGSQIATGGDDNKIVVRSTADGKETNTLSGGENWVTALRFNNNGKLLAEGD